MLNEMDSKAFTALYNISRGTSQNINFQKTIKIEESGEDSGTCSDKEPTSDFSDTELDFNTDSLMRFHISENKNFICEKQGRHAEDTFAGPRYLGLDGSTIRSTKGSIRGVKNRVRAGIATFLQMKDSKNWQEREAGQIVVYTTTMGVIRETYQRCLKVRHILRNHLIKYTEKDVFMSRDIQTEIKERMGSTVVCLPQVFIEGVHLGDADMIEKLNESGELRRILKPYKNPEVCMTCSVCGGYRLLPCGVCNGSKKSVHRNHFNSELIALKCMNCDEVGLVRCYAC